jgi:hypothetical protein
MGSNYVDDLEAWVKEKGSKKPDANVAAFLAVRDLVKARLDDGFSATIIHAFLRDSQQIDFCYDTFLKYVHRYVRPPRKRQLTKSRIALTGDQKPSVVSASTVKSDTFSGIQGFTFSSTPNREELI